MRCLRRERGGGWGALLSSCGRLLSGVLGRRTLTEIVVHFIEDVVVSGLLNTCTYYKYH